MPRASTFAALTVAAIGVAWVLPLVRAVRLFRDASEAYADTGSINDGNDYRFSQLLLVSYVLSLAVAAVLSWLWFRTRAPLLMLPLAGSVLIAFDVIRLKPESVIVFFPTMDPFRPVWFSLIVALAAGLILVLRRGSRRSERV